ncbi:citrinin biosynthesis transporter CtnC [Histoplasma capsulatum H143]|uniref:Citrinin biosynthesis transporter CtnC n=1 Tax=Ajellomyces capsulatus (strain H143) TaxID=544712 RepID=C6HBZ9_AJECH|nr:citrinin biosynthesis transporter CtnC [Histoplasma capsulatum H143]
MATSLQPLLSNDTITEQETFGPSNGIEIKNTSRGYSWEGDQTNADIETDAQLRGARYQPDTSTAKDPNLVQWEGPSDPGNPMNWSLARKWYITIAISCVAFLAMFSSSVFAPATGYTAEEYHVSELVMTLGTSLVLLGFAFGPLIWAPLSEVYGRMTPLWVGFVGFTIFQIPVATAHNAETILIFRFLIGIFGASTGATIAGIIFDIWDPVTRGVGGAVFAVATFVGPVAGPILGSFIVESKLGWRWTAWLTFIFSGVCAIIGITTIRETYAPVILQRRAAQLRKSTRNWALHSELDEHMPTWVDLFTKYFSRPPQMLIKEPILLFMTIYIAVTYGMLYLFFFAYPISFLRDRGWKNAGVASLPLLGLSIGIIVGLGIIAYGTKTHFARKLKERGSVSPEDRLPEVIIGAVCLPIGLFWFSWTSSPEISWVAQALAGIPIGAGIIIIFLQGINYLIDVYMILSNSAIAVNTFVRCITAAAFPLFAVHMYEKLGVNWAGSLLGFLSLALVPLPILLYFYGARIRAMSRFQVKQ